MKKILNNQEGGIALLGAFIISIAITTTLSTFYIYSANQSKYHAKIKEAYQMINVMESFASMSRKAYISASNGTCSNGNLETVNGQAVCVPVNNQFCVTRQDSNLEYCTMAFSIDGTITPPVGGGSEVSKLEYNEDKSYLASGKPMWAKKWLKKLNYFYASPALYNKDVDTALANNIIKKPAIADWFFKPAYALISKDQDKGEVDSGMCASKPEKCDGYQQGGFISDGSSDLPKEDNEDLRIIDQEEDDSSKSNDIVSENDGVSACIDEQDNVISNCYSQDICVNNPNSAICATCDGLCTSAQNISDANGNYMTGAGQNFLIVQ